MIKTKNLVLLGAAAWLLAACGGGGGGGEVAPPVASVPGSDVPQAATQSADAAFAFVSEVAARGEGSDVVNIGDATLATTDTDEARPL